MDPLYEKLRIMAKKFKAHKMYGPKGQVVMAKTMKQHLALKAKKYNHKPKKK